MNKEELIAIQLYCRLTFGMSNINIAEAIDCINEDAFAIGLTYTQYIDYLIVNGYKPC